MLCRVILAGCLAAGANSVMGSEPVAPTSVPVGGVMTADGLYSAPPAVQLNKDGDINSPADEKCIDFEVGAPCSFEDTGPLRDLFADQGIHFEGPDSLDGGGILDQCGNFGIDARSGTNFLAFNRRSGYPNGGEPIDPELVRFDDDASSVSVYVSGGRNNARWRMDAYDSGGGLVDSHTISTADGVWGKLAVSGSGIRSVVVTETLDAWYFVWDDLCVTMMNCLDLSVNELIAGQSAVWSVGSATPNAEVAIVYGHDSGNTSINGFAGYCADFGIRGVNQNRVICRKKADGNGDLTCRVNIPDNASGVRVLSQAAERGTCPDTCMSNFDDQVVN